jgi:3-hydroxy-9,10-secoandrosta-1,3,5(10)-triene-9,17-dione monooxygenase
MFSKAGEPIGPGIALVPMSDVAILHDWDTIGIRGSGSSNVSMENVFIPDDHIVSLFACNEGRQPRAFPNEALYRSAFAPLMVGVLTFPVLGLGMHMLEEFLHTLPKRDIKLTPYTKAGEAAVTHLQLGQASAKVDAARTIVEKLCREIDDCAAGGNYMDQVQRAALCRDSAFADQLVWEAVDLLADASGGSFSRIGNTANRIWQDVKVGTAHPFVSLASNYELYGRMIAGVEPALMPV